MVELDHKKAECWCFWAVVLEKTLESPLDCKEIKSVHPKVNQLWIFIRRSDAEAEVSVLWPLHMKSQVFRKDPDARKNWRQEKKGMTEDGWLDGMTDLMDMFEWASSGSWWWTGSLAYCSPWGHKELDTTEWLNWWFMCSLLLGCHCFYVLVKRAKKQICIRR